MGFFIKNDTIVQKICSCLITTSLAVVFFLYVLVIAYTPHLSHDTAAYLTAGQMIVGGAHPYADIIDTNFPMIMYISAIPAGFSSLTHVPLAVSGIVFFFCASVFTMLLFGKILRITFPELTRQQIQLVYIVWLYGSFSIYSAYDFGQREHLIFLFIAPFLILRHARYLQVQISPHLSIPTALIAFCGVAIKPFFVFPILVIEIIQAISYRRFRKPFLSPETGVFILSGLLYMAHFYFFSGMAAFYDYWLGFMMRGYIRGTAYAIGTEATIRTLGQIPDFYPCFYPYCVAAFLLSFLFLYDKRSLFFLSSSFGWFACCSLILFIWQKKGWYYQLVPFYYSCWMGGALLCLASRKFFAKHKDAYMLLLALAAVILMLTIRPPFDLLREAFAKAPFSFGKTELAETIESLTKPNDGVLFLDTSTWPGFPDLTYTGRKLGGRFITTWPLAFFFKDSDDYIPKKEFREDESRFYKMLEEDIDTFRPKLIFIRTDMLQATDSYFRLPEYLSRRGFMKKISSSYHFVGMAGPPNFEVWRYNESDGTAKN